MESVFRHPYRTPFDDTAPDCRKRMGLLLPNGRPDEVAVRAAAHIYAGLLYEYLQEALPDRSSADMACKELAEENCKQDAAQKVLALCLLYDAVGLSLPDPLWWICGDLELAAVFAEKVFGWLLAFCEETETTGCAP